MKGRAFAIAGIAVMTFAGCGGDDDGGGNKTFDEQGFAITFSYPAAFDPSTDINVDETAGATGSGERAAVALDEENGVFVIKTSLNIPITSKNLERATAEFNDLTAQLAGHEIHGQETQVGGLPALRYPPFDYPKAGVRSRLTVIFDQQDEYELNCQWDDRHEAEVQKACDLALSTLEPKSG
jgi:hypothetical protein